MARRSLGAPASAGSQLVTLAEVQALIAAGGAGGGTLAGNRPAYPGPQVGETVRQFAVSIESQRHDAGMLRLGHCHLPAGTYDLALVPISNFGASGQVLRFMGYKVTSGGGVGDLLYESGGIPATANTHGSMLGGALNGSIGLVVPAGGMDFWGGTVAQGYTDTSTSPNIPRISRAVENSVFSGIPSIHFAVTFSVMRLTGVTGTAPATGAAATRDNDNCHSWMTFRRSA